MIHKLFGIIDIFVAILLYFGNIPGPRIFVNAIVFLLLAKGAVSLVYLPFLFIPGIVMGVTDVLAVVLLIFGNIALPAIKEILIIVILVKALPALLMDVGRFVG